MVEFFGHTPPNDLSFQSRRFFELLPLRCQPQLLTEHFSHDEDEYGSAKAAAQEQIQ